VYSPQGMGFTGALGCPGSCKLDLLQCAVDVVLVDGISCVARAAKLATAVGCSLVLEWEDSCLSWELQTCAAAVGCSSGTWAWKFLLVQGAANLFTAVGCSLSTGGSSSLRREGQKIVVFASELRFSSVRSIQLLMFRNSTGFV